MADIAFEKDLSVADPDDKLDKVTVVDDQLGR